MKRLFFLTLICMLSVLYTQAQSADSTAASQAPKARTFTRGDSLYLAKLNSGSNIMIASGVALCGVGGYLIYNGYTVYTTPIDRAATQGQQDEAERQNHKQGTIYMAVGGVAIAGGLVLTALGTKNKIQFKKLRKRYDQQSKMTLQGGLLDNGNLGLALTF